MVLGSVLVWVIFGFGVGIGNISDEDLAVYADQKRSVCNDDNDDDAYQNLIIMMSAKEYGYERQPHDASGVHCETNISVN